MAAPLQALAVETAGYTGHNYLEYQVDNYTENGFVYSEQNIPLVGCTVSYNKNYGDGYGWHPLYIQGHEYSFTSTVHTDLRNGDYIKWVYFPLGYFTDKNDYNLNHCISLNGLRSGTTVSFKVTESNEYLGFDPVDISYYIWIQYYDINGKSVTGGEKVVPDFQGSGEYIATFDIQPPDNAVAFRPYFQVQLRLTNLSSYGWNAWNSLDYFQFRCVINETDYANNLTWYTSNKQSELAQQGNTLLEAIQSDLQNLPGQIGDAFQDVIDKENEKHESEGNKFVDQLLDILPDPSQDVLVALGSLAGATGYTGTDAVLPIPAIVLPGISGLFPETVLWGGGQLDFGEYLGVIPSSLLTLVQSLFTIAIVLFCVFELKGIISYCLTLRSGKGVSTWVML